MGLLWKMEKPRHLLKSVLFLISNMDLYRLAQSSLQLVKKITLDFRKLTFNPEAALNSSMEAKIVSQFFLLALANRVRSSVNNMCDILRLPLLMLVGNQSFLSTAISIVLDSLAIQIMNRYREMGSPCLIPLVGLK